MGWSFHRQPDLPGVAADSSDQPSGQIVAALSLDVRWRVIDTIGVLEDCYFGDVQIGEAMAEE